MAFSRNNTGSSVSFTRDGAVSTFNQPSFQVFSASTTKSNYSLGGSWSIQVNSEENKLKFLNNKTPILTLTPSGAELTLTQLKLPSYAQGVTPSVPQEGLLINQDGDFLVYI
jgi:hypothetical protein